MKLIVSSIVSDVTLSARIFELSYVKRWIFNGHMRSMFIIGKLDMV